MIGKYDPWTCIRNYRILKSTRGNDGEGSGIGKSSGVFGKGDWVTLV